MKCYMPIVTAIAIGEVGYTEKKALKDIWNKLTGSGANNYTKYAWYFDNEYTDFYNGKKQGASWCDIFVDWCFVKAYGVDNALRLLCQPTKSSGAGCRYSLKYFMNDHRFFAEPKVGDQIFFGTMTNVTHTGLVIKVDNKNKKVYTIEGNKSNAVKECAYKITDNNIVGYGRPDYAELPLLSEMPMVKKGSRGENVKFMQSAIITLGYYCGSYGADGDFGAKTDAAVREFQKDNRLVVDGIVGIKTWAKILEEI